MCIVRVKHDKENPYVVINRQALWDENLSLQAVGLWSRLLSRPDDWNVMTSELAKSCNLHIDTINKILKELIKNGYVHRVQNRKKDAQGKYPNRFGKWEYWIFEKKVSKEEISNILSEPVLSAPIDCMLLSNEDLPKGRSRHDLPARKGQPQKRKTSRPETDDERNLRVNILKARDFISKVEVPRLKYLVDIDEHGNLWVTKDGSRYSLPMKIDHRDFEKLLQKLLK